MQFFIVLALLIAVAIVLFALQNSAVVTISFLSLRYDGSLAMILVVVFTLGLLAGILISIPSLLRKSSDLREQKRKVKQLEQSIDRTTISQPLGQDRSVKNQMNGKTNGKTM